MKVLAVGAHPDDIEIGCGGTLAKLVDQGAHVECAIATMGERGSQTVSKDELTQVRKAEALSAAQTLGVHQVHFLGMEDGLTGFSLSEKVRMIELIRSIRPDSLFVHAQQDHFPDHAVISSMTLSAIQAAMGPWYQEVALPCHCVTNIYGYEVWHPLNRWQMTVDISGYMNKKLAALSEHRSQLGDMNYLDAVKGLASYRGAMTHTGNFAEVFEVLQTDLI